MIRKYSSLRTAFDLPGLPGQYEHSVTSAATDFESINLVEAAPAYAWSSQSVTPVSRSNKVLHSSVRAHCSTPHGETKRGWWKHCQKFDPSVAHGGLTFADIDPRNQKLLGHDNLAETLGPRSETTEIMAGGKRRGVCVRKPESLHPRVGMANGVNANNATGSDAVAPPRKCLVIRGHVCEDLGDPLRAQGGSFCRPGFEMPHSFEAAGGDLQWQVRSTARIVLGSRTCSWQRQESQCTSRLATQGRRPRYEGLERDPSLGDCKRIRKDYRAFDSGAEQLAP